jgi:hypothetical protein
MLLIFVILFIGTHVMSLAIFSKEELKIHASGSNSLGETYAK